MKDQLPVDPLGGVLTVLKVNSLPMWVHWALLFDTPASKLSQFFSGFKAKLNDLLVFS